MQSLNEVARRTGFTISSFADLNQIGPGLDRLGLGMPARYGLDAARLSEEAR